jgi:hypothetical protein
MAYTEVYLAATAIVLAFVLYVSDVLVPSSKRRRYVSIALRVLTVVLLILFVVGVLIIASSMMQ